MSYLKHLTALSIILLLSACSSIEKKPLPSTEAQSVKLTEDINLIKTCKKINSVIGYGTYDVEVKNDIRHQAATQYNANVVLLHSSKEFYQTTRLENYLRTPKMKAPKGTVNYYYEDAFTLKAKGTAYLCP